ncbi:MAG: PAS domain S-box protein [Syntrophaceae bacterium]
MDESSYHDEEKNHDDYLKLLYRRHFQGALVRSGASVIMWLFALAAFLPNIINMNQFMGITLSVVYLILINPPTLLLLKRITNRHTYGYASLLINFLEVLGYTAIIYFRGGIEAPHLTLIYAALITYVGAMAPRSFPYFVAIMCSAAYSFVVAGEHFGFLPRYSTMDHFILPWLSKWDILSVVVGLLFVVAYISSLTAATLRKNRKKMSEQNLELMEKTRTLEEAQNELCIAHQELERRVEKRTFELARANEELESELTARKQAEAALKEAHDILSKSPAVAFLWKNQEGWPVEFVTDNVEALFGYTAEEFMSGEVVYSKILHPGDLDRVAQEVANINQDKEKKAFTHQPYRILTKDGQAKWVEDRTYIRRDEKGNITHHQGIVEDITGRMWADKALKESEEKYRLLFESALEGIMIVQDEKMKFANPALVELLGYPSGILTTQPFTAFIHPEDRKMVLDRHMRRMNGESVETDYPFRIVTSDGTEKWLQIDSKVISWDGAPASLSFVIDITKRKQAEEALRKSEEKYRAIIENMEEGYVEVDLTGRLTFFNEAAQIFFGHSAEETMGMKYKQYADEENARKIFTAYNEVYRTGVPLRLFEWEVIRKDGARRTIEGSASLIRDIEGHPVGFRGIFRDITDRKHLQEEHERLQERLHRGEKMEALGTLAGGIAHDLNNVLGIVVGYSELLLSETDETSKKRSRVMNIMQGGQRAAAIVQDMLTLARRGVQTRKVININTTIDDYQKSPEFEKLLSFHPNVQIKTNLEAELLNIVGSPVHLSKALFNLVSNAVEAMLNGGVVAITTSNVYLDRPIRGYEDVKEGDYVVLSVSDTGEGIPSADLKRIFEPFYTKKVMGRSGTGLGLAVVWGTVKDHNGYITVESKEGKGTTFNLYFPITREEVLNDQLPVSVSEYMGNGETILVVDDVEGQRELAAQMLAKLNYTVSNVSSGEAAVEYAKKNQTDLIVLDMIMEPGMDGLDTYRSILKIHPKQKAIIVSGFSETDRVINAQTLGAGSYVRKPYVIEKLGLAVRKELDKNM